MFRRLFFDDWVSLFPLIAFITAASIYLAITYRALRMRPPQVNALSRLPFNDDATVLEPSSRHDDK